MLISDGGRDVTCPGAQRANPLRLKMAYSVELAKMQGGVDGLILPSILSSLACMSTGDCQQQNKQNYLKLDNNFRQPFLVGETSCDL